jgi:hypothetical protein
MQNNVPADNFTIFLWITWKKQGKYLSTVLQEKPLFHRTTILSSCMFWGKLEFQFNINSCRKEECKNKKSWMAGLNTTISWFNH